VKPKLKQLFKCAVPKPVWLRVRSCLFWLLQRLLDAFDLTAARRSDFSSPLPYLPDLAKTRPRWDRPSSLGGVRYDLEKMKGLFRSLVRRFEKEFQGVCDYKQVAEQGLGWGFPEFDAMLLYFMMRDIQPSRYFEVGSGMTTYYSKVAGGLNKAEGRPLEIVCIEPHPFPNLKVLGGVELITKEVQDLPPSFFDALESGDVLLLDSSHILKIDGDVPFLYLEILPRLKPGVVVHCHDIPFPYNTPFPSDFWLFNNAISPMFWTEAMVAQSFLCFNASFEIIMSTPLIRYYEASFLKAETRLFQDIAEQPNTFSSLWLRRV
jgi:hypothetical protein